MHPHLSTELALKQFDADAAFGAALAKFQAQPPASTIIKEAQRAAAHGFSWFARPSEPGFVEVRLRHAGGAENSAEGESVTALLAGLLGHPIALKIGVIATAQAAEPEQEEATVGEVQALADALSLQPQPVTSAMVAASLAAAVGERLTAAIDALPPSPAQAAAESLAAATGGVVVTEPSEYVPDPEQPLTNQEKADAEAMLRGFTPEKRKRFTISYRDAFRVPREEKGILPTVTKWKHLQYFYNWEAEASGGVAA